MLRTAAGSMVACGTDYSRIGFAVACRRAGFVGAFLVLWAPGYGFHLCSVSLVHCGHETEIVSVSLFWSGREGEGRVSTVSYTHLTLPTSVYV